MKKRYAEALEDLSDLYIAESLQETKHDVLDALKAEIVRVEALPDPEVKS